jgi:hypothetical protein
LDIFISLNIRMNEDKKVEKVEKKYNCVCCDYFTSQNEHYIKHLSTHKHKQACKRTNSDNLGTNEDKNVVNVVNLILLYP